MRAGRARRLRVVAKIAGVAVLVLAAVAGPLASVATDRYYLPRVILWRDADVGDHRRFPSRKVSAAPSPIVYRSPPDGGGQDPRLQTVPFGNDDPATERELTELLASSGTSAFLVLHDAELSYERYFDGYDRELTLTSFSVAKSFVSALVGIAIAEGHINGVDDPITDYLPELRDRDPGLSSVTIRHLLTMSSGIRYDKGGAPWSADDTRTYYETDLRRLALSVEMEGEPGTAFEYNNYHPLLLGLILERSTGVPVARYLEDKLWQPLGAEGDGSSSLDSEESGINGRAVDFAKFGGLYLQGGTWQGRQVVTQTWVDESTRVDAIGDPARNYQYFWWVGDGGHFSARGNHRQYMFVAPDKDLVIVRFGSGYGPDGRSAAWMAVFEAIAARFDPAGAASPSGG